MYISYGVGGGDENLLSMFSHGEILIQLILALALKRVKMIGWNGHGY